MERTNERIGMQPRPQLFAAVDVLVAIITSAKNDSSANGSHAASFASVWTLFMVVAVSVTGTVILKKV